jgi:hypothetical protein
MVGYGLSSLEHNEEKFTDARLDPHGILSCVEREDTYHMRHFFDHLAKKAGKWTVELFALQFYEPYVLNCIHVLPKDGILLLIPPDKVHMWYRRDDLIDSVIETEFFNMDTNCGKLSIPIPPYKDFMNSKTGAVLDPEEVQIYIEKTRLVDNDSTAPKARKQLNISLDEGAKRMGFANANEADKLIVPAIPGIIIEMASWMKLFRQSETVYQLRPLTLAYWD